MEALKLFLNALEARLEGTHRGVYVPKLNVLEGTFKAYKTYTIEVWLIDGSYKILIAKVEDTRRIVTEEEKSAILKDLNYEAIKEVLKYYGI